MADLITGQKGRSWPGEGLTDYTAEEIKSWGDAWEMPKGVLVIADNGGGDLLLLLPDNTYGVRDHETRELIPLGVRLKVDEGEL